MPKGFRRRHLPQRDADLSPAPAATVVTVDDPESDEWFQRLPPDAQEETRKAWAEEKGRVARRETFAKTSRTRSMLQAAGVFLFTETAVAIPTLWHTIAAVFVGAGVGWWWHRIGAGRMRCMTSSIWPYVALRLAFVDARNSWALALTCITACVGFLALLSISALVGYVRETRRADDLDY